LTTTSKECKRRKVRCDGQIPCARCAGQSIGCEYVPADHATPSSRSPTVAKILQHHSPASASSPAHRSNGRTGTLELSRLPPEFATNVPEFCGPSSTEYVLNSVSGNLRAMGMQSAILDKHSESGVPATSSGRLAQYGPFMKLLNMDPLWDMTREDAKVLIDDCCEGLGTVYPVLSRATMTATVDKVFHALRLAHAEGLRDRGGSVVEALFDHNTNKLKIVLAIGMTKEAGGCEHQAQPLFQSTSEVLEGLIWNPEGLHGIQLLYLVAMYHYHLNEEVRTGRCIAFAARLCLEAGLHRRVMLDRLFPDPAECEEALHAFWAVYMLERRLSLGQGIPFFIQDSYIDRSLYTSRVANPLLPALLQWTKLAGKVWHALNNQTDRTSKSRIDDINYLDYEIMTWYDALPAYLQLPDAATWSQDAHHELSYYHSIIFVRKPHLRNLVYRPVLQSPIYARQNEPVLLKAIEVSKETIRTLHDLKEHTSLVWTHPMFFQQLLLTAFGNLLLAVVSTGPSIRSSSRNEFDMFLRMFHQLGSECAVLRQTWQRLQGLRDLHTMLGHLDRNAQNVSTDSNASPASNATIVPLCFDDIFPDITNYSATGVSNDTREPLVANGQHCFDLGFVPDDFMDLSNVFDFPFVDLM
ncbi:hypothetical protein EK21DRAFT_56190, partial [Setomelanomma holmii]